MTWFLLGFVCGVLAAGVIASIIVLFDGTKEQPVERPKRRLVPEWMREDQIHWLDPASVPSS